MYVWFLFSYSGLLPRIYQCPGFSTINAIFSSWRRVVSSTHSLHWDLKRLFVNETSYMIDYYGLLIEQGGFTTSFWTRDGSSHCVLAWVRQICKSTSGMRNIVPHQGSIARNAHFIEAEQMGTFLVIYRLLLERNWQMQVLHHKGITNHFIVT